MMMNKISNEISIYQTENGEMKLKENVENESVWANKKDISEIFGVERSIVTKHIRNIYKDNEVDKTVTCAKVTQVQDGDIQFIARNCRGWRVRTYRGFGVA